MSSNKLHPIYAALDSHQYTRAIKLASALPDSNVIGKALLAHAYSKSGQRYQSLLTLKKIVGPSFFELQQELALCPEAAQEASNAAATKSNQTSEKKGKKGKKGKAAPKSSTSNPVTSAENPSPKELDIFDQLSQPPILPKDWNELPAADQAITDETTLATFAATLKNLKLPLTIYQLYSWAVAADPSEILLTRTFCSGVSLLCYPTKYSASDEATISAQVLASMQSNALQLARLALSSPGTGSTMSSLLATSWAAQCALWQLKFLPDDPQRSMILPRLAESMTKKLVEQESSPSAEIQWIYLRALEQQSNHSDMLERLNQLLMDATAASHPTEFGVALTPNQILLEKAKVLCKLDQFEAASDIYEKLISRSPDDFSCWMQHLDCSFKSTGTTERTKTLVAEILDAQKDSKYPLRGPNLVKVELQARQLRTQGESDSGSAELAAAIKSYAETFASRVVCCFSDLENYLDLLSSHEATSNVHLASLLDWIESCRIQNNFDKADTDSIRQNKLRAFICCCKMTHKLQSRTHDMDRNHLPPLGDLLEQWKFSFEYNKPAEGNETQKEIRPDDELLLVIVQQVLQAESCSPKSLVTAAALLEMAIKCSPYNSYLKICCIGIYHRLGATSRSWELFQGVGLKHIQLDSCTYVILPMLMSGGLFNEAIDVCNAMIRFQAGTARETGDYAGRAMENGTLSKGNEFIEFQREKMNNSLTMLQAKAFILDAAPLLANPVSRKKFDEDPVLEGGLGTIQGIVGGESDVERATRMIPEVYNPNAALQVVSWADRNDAPDSSTQDNRDLSILSYETLVQGGVESKDDILKASRLCGHTHSLLILATLCIEATKSPKKGKLVKTSPELEKRTLGLLDMCDKCLAVAQNRFAGEGKLYDLRKSLVGITTDLCRTLALLVAGLPTRDREDTLDTREKAMVESLELVSGKVEPLSASLTAATIHDMFQILAHELVALFAIFRKLADVLSTFGWGKRKRKTKACAEAMAVLASHLEVTVTTLLSTLDSLPETEDADPSTTSLEIDPAVHRILDDDISKQTLQRIIAGQFRTRARAEPILREMVQELESFDVKDD